MNQDKSRQLFERACGLFPGGVNSPVRAFLAVGGTPVFLARGEGANVWDADGNKYTDFLGSWGPLILGHANPAVVATIAAVELGILHRLLDTVGLTIEQWVICIVVSLVIVVVSEVAKLLHLGAEPMPNARPAATPA